MNVQVPVGISYFSNFEVPTRGVSLNLVNVHIDFKVLGGRSVLYTVWECTPLKLLVFPSLEHLYFITVFSGDTF